MNKLNWHFIGILGDWEVLDGPLGLGPPVTFGWDLDGSKGVFFDSDLLGNHPDDSGC